MSGTNPSHRRSLALLVTSLLFPVVSLRAQDFSVWLGDATGEPGEVVSVAVHASSPEAVSSVGVALAYDAERLRLVGVSADGTGFEGIYEEALFFKIVTPGEAYAGIESHSVPIPLRVDPVPPGADLILARLRFRIRAAAAEGAATVTPLERVDRLDSQIAFDTGHGLSSEIPDPTGGAGRVTVLEPSGPRPVSDLACRQFLDRAELTFSPTEPYDAIELRRDGALVAMLAGDASSASATLDSEVPGSVEFSLLALVGDADSVAVACEVDVTTPAAPRVEDFSCKDGALSWSQGRPETRIPSSSATASLRTEIRRSESSTTCSRHATRTGTFASACASACSTSSSRPRASFRTARRSTWRLSVPRSR